MVAHFCTDTLLQTDDVAHRDLYTEQLLCADTLREICAQRNFYTQTPLRTEASTQRSFYTQKLLHTDALHKDAFAPINKGTQALLHQNLLHRETFAQNSCYTKKLLHRKALTQKNLPTQTAQRSFYIPKLLLAETLPRAAFTHRNFSAQKPLRTEGFMHSSFYTDAFAHRCLYTIL